jgi:hypothetical protein
VNRSFMAVLTSDLLFDCRYPLDSAAPGNVACNSHAATHRYLYIRNGPSSGFFNPKPSQ